MKVEKSSIGDILKYSGLQENDTVLYLGGRMPNRMIVFAPSSPNKERPPTWHEVKRLSSKLVGTRNSFQMFFYKNNNK